MTTKEEDLLNHIMKTVEGIEGIIFDEANIYPQGVERVNYALSCAVNLLGRLVMNIAEDDIERAASLADQTQVHMKKWFEGRFNLGFSKGAH